MNTTRILSFAIATASVLISAARAQDGFVHSEVAVETRIPLKASAIPHGDLDVSSLNPSGDIHPAQGATSTLTRAQVRAELARWVADGMAQVGETGVTAAEINPSRYPQTLVSGLTRGQVRTELAMAGRYGGIPFGEIGLTPAQLNPSRYAEARERDRQGSYAQK